LWRAPAGRSRGVETALASSSSAERPSQQDPPRRRCRSVPKKPPINLYAESSVSRFSQQYCVSFGVLSAGLDLYRFPLISFQFSIFFSSDPNGHAVTKECVSFLPIQMILISFDPFQFSNFLIFSSNPNGHAVTKECVYFLPIQMILP
jgi:hypothetical protein